MFICVWGPQPHTTPHTLCTCTQYTYSHRKEGGESWTREKVIGATVHKAGWKIPTWLTVSPLLQSIISIKTPVKTTFRVWCLTDIWSMATKGLTWKKKTQNPCPCLTVEGRREVIMYSIGEEARLSMFCGSVRAGRRPGQLGGGGRGQ